MNPVPFNTLSRCQSETSSLDLSYSRRGFVKQGACLALLSGLTRLFPGSAFGGEAAAGAMEEWNPEAKFLAVGRALRVQPVLMYATPQKRELTSWKSWGGVLDEESASQEVERIQNELQAMKSKAEFGMEILPVLKVKSPEEAKNALKENYDVVMVFPASGSGTLLQACVPAEKDALIFVRHRNGPTYYWYEALSTAYLQTDGERDSAEPPRLGRTHVDDVAVDDFDEVLWRLRALYGVANLRGSRIVALGGVWGKYAPDAPEIARRQYGMEVVEIGYDAFAPRIQKALGDSIVMARAEKQAVRYLALPGTSLETDRPFVVNAFVVYELFKQLMQENEATAFTVKECMSTIIPMSKTTACLSLSLLSDEGRIAFCESDFVVIPAGLLLRHIAQTPVFLHNSTFPHKGILTCAHCSAPRRMNGDRYEPVRILTHEESEYGAAPKVEIPLGQEVTFIDPEYTKGRWLGFRGHVEDNPFLPICRSQQDVRIQGDWKELLNEVRDSHWLMAYGSYLNEAGYAARKLGVRWENLSDVG